MEPLEPRTCLESLEDLARLVERRLVAGQLSVLEQRDRKPEGDADLTEPLGRGVELGWIAGEPPAEAVHVCIEEWRPAPRWHRIELHQQLLGPLAVVDRDSGFECLHDALLDGLVRDAETLLSFLDLAPGIEGFAQTTRCAFECGGRAEEADALLHVGGFLEAREERVQTLRLGRIAALEMDLERAAEQAQEHPARARLLLRQLVRDGERLVPASEHEQGVCPLGEDRPLLRPVSHPPHERERVVEIFERVLVPVAVERVVREEEVRAARLFCEAVLEGDRELLLEQRGGLLRVSAAVRNRCFRAERERQRLRVAVRLGEVERQLCPLGRQVEIAGAEVRVCQPSCEECEIFVRLVERDDVECALHPCEPFVEPAGEALDSCEPSGDAGGSVRVALDLVKRERLLEEASRSVRIPGTHSHLARLAEERSSLGRIVREVCRVLEVPPGLGGRGQRLCALSGAHDRGLSHALDLCGVFCVGCGIVSGDVVRRDDLDDFVLVLRECSTQVSRGGEVPGATLLLRERLVGDMPNQVLEEAVLAMLGRARVGLHTEHLLACEGDEHRLEVGLGAREGGQRISREGLAENRRVLEQPPLFGGQAVESSRDEGVQCLRDFERFDLAREPVRGAVLHEQAAVEQHPHRLDRVERDAFGAREDAVANLEREPRHEPGQQFLHGLLRERLEIQRCEAPLPGAPGRPALHQLWPCERDHEDRVAPRPVEQVLDEVEQARVGPLHVLEGEHRRIALREALEEEPPRGEEILLVARLVLRQPEQVREARLEEAPLFGVEEVLLERGVQLGQRRRRLLLLGDAAAHAHHVGECPVRHALAVGEAPPAVPVHGVRDPVEVLVELPREPRLADAGDAGHRDEVRLALVGAGVEEVLDLAKLAVAPDERRLEALRLERAAQAGDDALRPPERRRALLALELERRLRPRRRSSAPSSAASTRPTKTVPGLGGRLDARRGVDEVAGDHALALRADRDGGFAGEDACAGAKLRCARPRRRARTQQRRGRARLGRRARRRPRSRSACPIRPSPRRR